jgi:lysophospholipase L1-like esterase
MNAITRLTPHMQAYSEEFADNGNINWLPYLMYFHPFGFSSRVVNTDASGFRYTEARNRSYSVADLKGESRVRVLAGSSTVFGIGASTDCHTLSARMTENDPGGSPWVNFGGRSFNSTQEMILFSLHHSKLPKVDEIVLFSGFNDLGLARQPKRYRGEHGAFFMHPDFFNAMAQKKPSRFSRWFGTETADAPEAPPSLDEQIDYAAGLMLRNLTNWKMFADGLGAKLVFMLQPLSNWVRQTGSPEEEILFSELERRGRFAETYGDILEAHAAQSYSNRLAEGAEALGVKFVDLAPLIARQARPEQWIFVDRIHFTDDGHDFVSKIVLDAISN